MNDQLARILAMTDRREAFHELASLYESSSPLERAELRSLWDFGATWEYPDQFSLAQNIPQQRTPSERIRASLVYDAIAGTESDRRERAIGLCLIYNSAAEIGMDPETLFKEVAQMAPDIIREELLDFAERAPQNKSLDAFCLTRVETESGIVFRLG